MITRFNVSRTGPIQDIRNTCYQLCSSLRNRHVREAGFTLLEVIATVAFAAIIGSGQVQNFVLEKQKTLASKSLNNMMAIGTKVQEYCDDTQRICKGLTNGTVTLPANYLPAIPSDPGATGSTNQYSYTFNTASDGSKCFSIEGVASYPNDAALIVSQADGTPGTESDTAPNEYLHYDSRQNTVYASTSNTSPVSGGC